MSVCVRVQRRAYEPPRACELCLLCIVCVPVTQKDLIWCDSKKVRLRKNQ